MTDKQGQLYVKVIEARNLIAADSNGLSGTVSNQLLINITISI